MDKEDVIEKDEWYRDNVKRSEVERMLSAIKLGWNEAKSRGEYSDFSKFLDFTENHFSQGAWMNGWYKHYNSFEWYCDNFCKKENEKG